MLSPEAAARVEAALDLIARTPGYQGVGDDLRARLRRGRIAYDPLQTDRAQTGLTGRITLGPEALHAPPLSLAQTLVHEHHHLHQFPLEKTLSFWTGVVRRQPVMRRYERPAYDAALRFLRAAARALPELADLAESEQRAVAAVFEREYGPARS